MVGIGTEAVVLGVYGFIVERGVSRGAFGGRGAERSIFSSTSLGFQSCWKLTIGLPGESLTMVGVGNLTLLSLSFMLVAARMSSPRISLPSLILMGSFSFSG